MAGGQRIVRIVFLDIDGVLNSEQSARYWKRLYKKGKSKVANGYMKLCPICQSNLLSVLEAHPDIKIVLSSTWRLFDTYKKDLKNAGMDKEVLSRIIDRTPNKLTSTRGQEIRMWLDEHPEVEDFIIIDDDHWGIGEFLEDKRFVNTKIAVGFSYYDADRVIKYFGEK